MIRALLALGLAGCIERPSPSPRFRTTTGATPPATPTTQPRGTPWDLGESPWSAVWVVGFGDAEVEVDGVPLAGEPFGPRQRFPWRTLSPGVHELWLRTGIGPLRRPFTVGDFGRIPDFRPQDLGPAVYRPSFGRVGRERNRLESAFFRTLDLAVELVPDDGGVAFRLLWLPIDGTPGCVVYADHGALSPTGELTWSADVRDVPVPGGTVRFTDLALHAGWSDDRLGGVEVSGTLAADEWQALLGTDPCELLDPVACGPCEAGRCLRVDFREGMLERSAFDAVGVALPDCATEEGLAPVSCACATASVGVPGAALALAVAAARRRRTCG